MLGHSIKIICVGNAGFQGEGSLVDNLRTFQGRDGLRDDVDQQVEAVPLGLCSEEGEKFPDDSSQIPVVLVLEEDGHYFLDLIEGNFCFIEDGGQEEGDID